jgi:hypothetical protein
MGYGVMVFNFEHGALPHGVMQDHGALPHDAVQYNHGAMRYGVMRKGSVREKNP